MTPAIEHSLLLDTTTPANSLRVIYRAEPYVAALALLAAAPALVVVAVIIALLARRTPLVRHRRVGWRGADLPVLKFRTMWEPNQPWAPLFAIEDVSKRYSRYQKWRGRSHHQPFRRVVPKTFD